MIRGGAVVGIVFLSFLFSLCTQINYDPGSTTHFHAPLILVASRVCGRRRRYESFFVAKKDFNLSTTAQSRFLNKCLTPARAFPSSVVVPIVLFESKSLHHHSTVYIHCFPSSFSSLSPGFSVWFVEIFFYLYTLFVFLWTSTEGIVFAIDILLVLTDSLTHLLGSLSLNAFLL